MNTPRTRKVFFVIAVLLALVGGSVFAVRSSSAGGLDGFAGTVFLGGWGSFLSTPPIPQDTVPTVSTDKPDYHPDQVVYITGTGWLPGETVNMVLYESPGCPVSHPPRTLTAVADESGHIANSDFRVNESHIGVTFTLVATGATSGRTAQVVFTDGPNPAGDLDQCANGGVGDPPVVCSGGAWQNGNLNQNQAHYLEGDSVPYRLKLTSLATTGSHSVTIEWDTTQGGKHATDYLTSFNRTEATADPCSDILSNAICSAPNTFPIPVDSRVTAGQNGVDDAPAGPAGGDDIAQVAGFFTLYGGTITSVSPYTLNGTYAGNSATKITINFTASNPDLVLAWGGHISTRLDWGQANSAVNISGSPYHMRLLDLDGSGGNQDRALSAGAVIFPATINIVKNVVSPSGDITDPQDFSFTTTGVGMTPSPFSLDDDNDNTLSNTQTFSVTDFGTKTVTEADPAPRFQLTAVSCVDDMTQNSTGNPGTRTATIMPQEGESITCTFTNTLQEGTLRVIKTVINDNGGTATAGSFVLHVKSGGSDVAGSPAAGSATGTDYTLIAGSYAVSEDAPPAGYTMTGFSGDCDSSGNVTVVAGQTKTCTITNDDQPGTLIVKKVVINDNGGTKTASDFSFQVNGGSATPFEGDGQNDLTVNAGTYSVTEPAVSGYTTTYDNCSDVVVANGETETCTVTNNDQPATLIVIKHVVNDNGGTADADDFTLDSGGANDSPDNFPGAESPGTSVTLDAGGYNVTETGPPGYTASFSSDCSGAIANGQTKTCTVTNDDDAPSLTLVKVVVNDNGGTATESAWTLTATGPTGFSGQGPSVSNGASFDAGTYALSESGPAGYTASAWVCVGGSQNGSDITLGLGQSATCTITNDDQTAHLKLVKQVVNDDGGDAAATDWTLSASGPTPISGAGGAESDVNAGSYNLSETAGPSGYTASAWACVGGTQNGAQVTLGLGQSATCTITNNDVAPTLKLVKNVTNDDGGNAVANDWTLSAGAAAPFDSRNFSNAGGSGAFQTVFSNRGYDLSESTVAGYTAGPWSCDGGTLVGSTVTLNEGETGVTCTITNDDVAPTLTLIKVVVNDNGGTAGPNDFGLSIGGNAAQSGVAQTVDANTAYAVNEAGLAGYAFVSITGDAKCPAALGGTVTLNEGENVTCTITNNDRAPHLTLNKVVVNDNGGTAAESAWTLSATGTGGSPTNLSGPGASGSMDVVSGPGFKADTYTLAETGPGGYASSNWVCNGGTQVGNQLTLGLGENARCTITNDDIAPKLHLRKVLVNNNGGTKTLADFTLTANGTGANDLSGISPVDSGAGLKADTWALSETNVYGYTASAWVCVGGTQNGSNITVGIGGEATCTITNDDQPGTIIVKKLIKPEGSSTTFSFDAGGTGYNDFSLGANQQNSQTLNAGSYTVKELVPLGWVLTGIGGSADPNTPYNCTVTGSGGSTGVGDLNTQTATVSLKNGDTVTCVFENTGQGVTRTQGFWATHPQLAQIAWFGGTAFGHTFPGVINTGGIGDNLICGRPLDDLGKVMGAFWSDVSKTSTGAKRSALDQVRMQLLQQLIAAELNASAFGSAPSSGSFAQWEAKLCGTNQNDVKNAQQQAASFNTAGDSGAFTPGTSADSKYARSVANIPFWNIIKP